MKGEGAVSSMSDALAYVEAHWRPGDIIFVTDDGPYINIRPYTDKPIYHLPDCAPVLGALSDRTRDALGMVMTDGANITYQRAWVFAPTSPLHPQCYMEYMDVLIANDPVYVVDNSDWLYSAVWLVEN